MGTRQGRQHGDPLLTIPDVATLACMLPKTYLRPVSVSSLSNNHHDRPIPYGAAMFPYHIYMIGHSLTCGHYTVS